MTPQSRRPLARILISSLLLGMLSVTSGWALTPRQEPARFDPLAIEPVDVVIATRAQSLAELAPSDALRSGWESFSARNGGWAVWLDQRSGLPALAQGAGIAWLDEPLMQGPDALEALEAKARAFLAAHQALLGSWEGQVRLDRIASGPIGARAYSLTFGQVIDGVPVDGARFDFHVVKGNLVAFGAPRWGRVTGSPLPRLAAGEARDALYAYLQVADPGEVVEDALPELLFVPVDPRGARAGEWTGMRGDGLRHRLVWRFRLHVPGEFSRWVADVDARQGGIVSLADETRTDRVKGGVFPLTSDGVGSEGTEQPGLPMPFADISINGGSAITASTHGLYTCSTPGAVVSTTLSGPYVRISDSCGALSESSLCGDGIDLSYGTGTNCDVPAGSSAGNTHASRTCFYQVNRAMEKARFWLPSNTWLTGQVTVNSNVNSTCNASWGGSLNMYRAGNGCRNTCEVQGVVIHELGHGLDQNDGGGYDNPSEAYSDVVAILEARESCVGRGFTNSNCGGYGDACLDCTGVRDEDWDMHSSHTPATPQGFLTNNCPGGGGPCGKEEHCEARVGSEAVFDLAARDLPAMGLDPDTGWQLAERLFYESRQGSGGLAYNCSLPNSDGCGTASWFHKLRLADDDDGNLNNGTPHAAAIYAAFARHNIACGSASDASNQNMTSCPSLARPALTASIEPGGIRLTWSAVPNAALYRVYRNELGCDRSQVPVATVTSPATSYLDDQIAGAVPVSYRLQAVGANDACESATSECRTLSLVGYAGAVELGRSSFACGAQILVRVLDGNAASGSLSAAIWSDAEPAAETVTLVETGAGSHVFEGSIGSSTGPAVHGDGILAVADGAQISVQYVDGNDGSGRAAVAYDTGSTDCLAAAPSTVSVTDVTDVSVTIHWTTAEPTTGRVEWGPTSSLGSVTQASTLGTDHAVILQPLAECGHYYFRVVAVDQPGNESLLDAGGQPFELNVGLIPGFLRDDFETTAGWTLGGEWQIDTPRGLGSNNPDPTAAFSGAKVLGHDLTGLGSRPGDYEKSTVQRAISPVLNGAGKTGLEIKFRRWLNVGINATAAVEVRVNGGSWTTVWNSNTAFGQRESGWSLQTVSLSPYADSQSNFQVAFRMSGGIQNIGASSWNVDRFVVRQASQPAGAVCGGCGGAPTFGGATMAVDADPCSTGGAITLSWQAAPAWGTGSGGTYSVYRGTTPGFVPGSGNRIATGLTATSYADTSVANGQTYHYLVRAENNETCGGGPNNGGLTDANTEYVAAATTSSQPLPVEVTGLTIQPPIGSDVRLTWTAAAGAPSHRAYRSSSPQPGTFSQLAQVPGTAANDSGAATDGATWFYLIRALNSCGQEGP